MHANAFAPSSQFWDDALHTLEDGVGEKRNACEVNDSEPLDPLIRTTSVGCPRKECLYFCSIFVSHFGKQLKLIQISVFQRYFLDSLKTFSYLCQYLDTSLAKR